MENGKKIFFASDLHLGADAPIPSKQREKIFVTWLDSIKNDAFEIYLCGDLFDFWFEYRETIPKGYSRLFGKLAELSDSGVKLFFFTGNHDLWVRDYFFEELGITILHNPIEKEIFGRKFLIGHGDGLGPGDTGYKFLKKVFTNPLSKFAFGAIHPDIGIRIANYFSKRSRKKGLKKGEDHGSNDFILSYCRDFLKKRPDIDRFVFGHHHNPVKIELGKDKYYFNLGDWVYTFTYLESTPEGDHIRSFSTDI